MPFNQYCEFSYTDSVQIDIPWGDGLAIEIPM